MGMNIDQLAVTTTTQPTDKLYLGRSPFGAGDDFAITFANLQANISSERVYASVKLVNNLELVGLYNNGVAGVGATLTNNGVQVALSIDGVLVQVGDRVLLPQQATNFYEGGIYTVTAVGSGASNWVLTRATDFDAPGEILQGGLIPVWGGDDFAGSIYVQLTQPAVIGVNPIAAFSMIDIAIIKFDFLQSANDLSDVSSASVAFGNISPSTTAGDLIVNDGVADVRLPIGVNQAVLRVNTAVADKMNWDGTILNTDGQNNFISGHAIPAGTGNHNLSIGSLCMTSFGGAGTGSNNITIGVNSLPNPGDTGGNLAIGVDAVKNNFTGSNNLGIGNNALFTQTTSIQNTAIGQLALFNSNANDNTAIGYSSLSNMTSGANNVGIGANVGSTLISGNSNVIIGASANVAAAATLNSVVIGSTAIGGSSCVAIGLEAGAVGANTVGIGTQALTAATGGNNTAIGASAGITVSTGTDNTLIGKSAASFLTTGIENTFIGESAGPSFGSPGVSTSVGVGIAANVNADNSVAIGANTIIPAIATQSIALGFGASPAAPNDCYLGSSSALGDLVFNGRPISLASFANANKGILTNNGIGNFDKQDVGADGSILMSDSGSSTGVSFNANVKIATGLSVSEAANGKQGTATLVAGVAVVANTSVTATSRIFLTNQNGAGAAGFLYVSTRTAGVSFTIKSSSVTDTGLIAFEIFEIA